MQSPEKMETSVLDEICALLDERIATSRAIESLDDTCEELTKNLGAAILESKAEMSEILERLLLAENARDTANASSTAADTALEGIFRLAILGMTLESFTELAGHPRAGEIVWSMPSDFMGTALETIISVSYGMLEEFIIEGHLVSHAIRFSLASFDDDRVQIFLAGTPRAMVASYVRGLGCGYADEFLENLKLSSDEELLKKFTLNVRIPTNRIHVPAEFT